MRNLILGTASFAGLALIALASRTPQRPEAAGAWSTHRSIRTRTGEPARLMEDTYFDVHGDASGSAGEYFLPLKRAGELVEKAPRERGDYSAPSER